MADCSACARHRAPGIPGSMAKRRRACAARSARSDVSRASGAREDESQIAGALRQRHQQLIRLRRDPDVVDVRHAARRLDAVDAAEDAAPRNRNHHHAGGAPARASSAGRFAERVAQQQLLERDRATRGFADSSAVARTAARARTGRRSAAPPPRARTRRSVVDAALGVNRAVPQAERGRGARRRRRRSRAARRPAPQTASRRSFPRRTDRRADRACRRSPATWSAPWCISPSSANSRPGMNPSTSARVVRVVPLGADVGRLQQRAQPVERRDERTADRRRASRRGCPTARAASRRTGYDSDVGTSDRAGSASMRRSARTRAPAGRRRAAARASLLVARDRGGRRRMTRQPERLGDARRDHRRPIADGEDAVDRPLRAPPRRSPRRSCLRRRSGSESRCPARDRRCRWQRSVANTRSTPSRSAASPNARV